MMSLEGSVNSRWCPCTWTVEMPEGSLTLHFVIWRRLSSLLEPRESCVMGGYMSGHAGVTFWKSLPLLLCLLRYKQYISTAR